MGGRPTPELAALNVHVPRGHAGYWEIIRALDRAGPWTTSDVVGRTNAAKQSAADYIQRLVRAGIAVPSGERPTARPGCIEDAALYRLARRPALAPRLRRDGSESPPTRQQQMWTAMRSLATFSFRELAHAASTDDVVVSVVAAKDYVSRLGLAGYLTAVQPGRPGTPTIWRLKPSMNTGPLAPLIMRTKFVWDANRGAVVGQPEPAEVQP
jgi:hypothetical protein